MAVALSKPRSYNNRMPESLTLHHARRIWMHAQRLDEAWPFGQGAKAVKAAIEHLGYVQIDTINVIERCHHHILFNRIPSYTLQDLHQCQTLDKTVFEYWTHALSYVPTRDYRYFLPEMKEVKDSPEAWRGNVTKEELKRVLHVIKADGPLSIQDFKDEVLVDKTHPWASRKPSKRALQLGFYSGHLAISERIGMLKKYDLSQRHFGWEKAPKPATEKQVSEYLLDRALRSQGLVSLDSICHLNAKKKPEIERLIGARVLRGDLVNVSVDGCERFKFWIKPENLRAWPTPELTHILSPFDPLIIQRKRLKAIFHHEHLFEAYLPKEKRIQGYFALPVLIGDEIVATLDLKTDRSNKKLLLQQWNWLGKFKSRNTKRIIEEALHDFSAFQLRGNQP